MSNWKAEWMVGTNKKAMWPLVKRNCKVLHKHYSLAVQGYLCRPSVDHKSPFHLQCGLSPLNMGEEVLQVIATTVADQYVEAIADDGIKASHAAGVNDDEKKKVVSIMKFSPDELFLVLYSRAVDSSVKWTAFQPRFYGSFVLKRGKHPLYELQLPSGLHTRTKIQACRLCKYYVLLSFLISVLGYCDSGYP